ncbi:MAG: hypothetical protein JWQ27_181 [Ferruginibacter sp.]|nr:hypothetical protein [Ferruginibacter sp.]
MILSVIVAFRNRELRRVQNFLDSLAAQTMQDFELIFIDQGSDSAVSSPVKQVVQGVSNSHYIYNDSEGLLFNKSQALNIGIRVARGKYLMIADIDSVFLPDFFSSLVARLSPGQFITHNALYLPEELERVTTKEITENKYFDKCIENFIGVCTASAEAFSLINGYDEFYTGWGGEDDDIIRRLKLGGYRHEHVPAKVMLMYHQWHPSRAPKEPSLWYLTMTRHLFQQKQAKVEQPAWGKMIDAQERPALHFYRDGSYKSGVQLNFSESSGHLCYNNFIEGFFNLDRSGVAFIDYPFSTTAPPRRKRTLFGGGGKEESMSTLLTKEKVSDFVEYFLAINRDLILDYYLRISSSNLLLVLSRK